MMEHIDNSLNCYDWTLRAMRYAADSPLDHAAWRLGEAAGCDLNVLDTANSNTRTISVLQFALPAKISQ